MPPEDDGAGTAYDEIGRDESLAAWQRVFGTALQAPPADTAAVASSTVDPGEEFVGRKLRIPVRISAPSAWWGACERSESCGPTTFRHGGIRVVKNRTIDFRLEECSVVAPYEVYWKVKNKGPEAVTAGQLRGDVVKGEKSR